MYRAGRRLRRRGMRFWWFAAILLAAVLASAYFVWSKPAPASLVLVTDHKAESKPKVDDTFRGLPVQLKIPSIGVDTQIEYVGNTSDGAMAAPSGPLVTGWYKYGAIPGEAGSSVIAGHVVGPLGEPGAFKRLSELSEGNTLQVVDAKGQTASFTVRSVRTYDESQQHDEVFNSASGTHLNLVTCAGEWDAAKREYAERLVVFAGKAL